MLCIVFGVDIKRVCSILLKMGKANLLHSDGVDLTNEKT